MKTEIVNPNISNFINSLRDIGYTFEIAVADVLDNSISAKATKVEIYTIPKPEIIFCLLDNGQGMSDEELKEAMRLASKDPNDKREKKDMGRFGLGLKTASFSQCKKLTVLSKQNKTISIKQWDLDYISKQNEWQLITPDLQDFDRIPLVKELKKYEHGTLVIWQNIDRYEGERFSENIDKLKKHLRLVFHRFLEGENTFRRLKIILNKDVLKPFNPFNVSHIATMEKEPEKIKIFDNPIEITPYILPHHSKLSQSEWEIYATDDGYIKSQGFYLYRLNRLLIHGTWWGLHKATDSHKLVRIKIDISNEQDKFWGIDIKKSVAHPIPELKKDLKRIILQVTEEGSRPFTSRGRKIKDKSITKFWQIIPVDNNFRFSVNKEHPIYEKLFKTLSETSKNLLNIYLNSLEAYLPIESIQSQLQQNPHYIKQESALSDDEIEKLVMELKKTGLSKEYIERLLKTEMFVNYKELLKNE